MLKGKENNIKKADYSQPLSYNCSWYFRCSSTVERVPVKDAVGGSNPPAGAKSSAVKKLKIVS